MLNSYEAHSELEYGEVCMIMSPPLRGTELTFNVEDPYCFHRLVYFFIWNCRGSMSQEFRLDFRYILDTYKLALVILLETHKDKRQLMTYEFNLSNVAVVPAEGQARGMTIL